MSHPRLTGLTLAAMVLAVSWSVYPTTGRPADPDKKKKAADRPAPALREIELSAVHSTSPQKGLVDVYLGLREGTPEWDEPPTIGQVLSDAKSPPMLAILRGENVKEAVIAAGRHVRLKDPPAQPVGPDDKSASKKYWLFVYLGSGHSSPLRWLVYPPTMYGTKIRFYYTRFDGWFTPDPGETAEATADDHAYLYWVPLGTCEDPEPLKAELVEFTKTLKAAYPAKQKGKK